MLFTIIPVDIPTISFCGVVSGQAAISWQLDEASNSKKEELWVPFATGTIGILGMSCVKRG
jgi:hypothetical protein